METRDLGLISEPEIAIREKRFGNRYAILRQPCAEGLVKRIRDADAMSLAGASEITAMLAATHDEDAAVRYWGAIGLGNVVEAANTAPRMHELLEDSSAAVRIAAARALCRWKQPESTLPVLVDILQNGAQWERLQAIITLDEIDDMARPVIKEMKSALEYRADMVAKGKYTVRVANRALNELLGTDSRHGRHTRDLPLEGPRQRYLVDRAASRCRVLAARTAARFSQGPLLRTVALLQARLVESGLVAVDAPEPD